MDVDAILGGEVRRVWPVNFDPEAQIVNVLKGACKTSAFPAPVRFLHGNLEVRSLPDRGRCIVAVRPLAVGELVLVDDPVATSSSPQSLAESLVAQCNSGDAGAALRHVMLGFYAGKGDQKAKGAAAVTDIITEPLIAGILLHNMHELEAPPIDGCSADNQRPKCGLWPLASMVNHSLRPNVARFFVGHLACYRLTRPLESNEELLDNYMDPRLPLSEREGFLISKHEVKDEGPDECDAPEALFTELERSCAKVYELLEQGRLEDACERLVRAVGQCKACGCTDPAFTDILWAFADIASELLQDPWLRLECLVAALEYATAREQFSTISCQIASLILSAAIDAEAAGLEHPAALSKVRDDFSRIYGPPPDVDKAEQLARKHCSSIFGLGPEIFENLNPKLNEKLVELRRCRRRRYRCLGTNATHQASGALQQPSTVPLSNSMESKENQPESAIKLTFSGESSQHELSQVRPAAVVTAATSLDSLD